MPNLLLDENSAHREENFYYDLLEDDHVSFVKGKVAKVEEDDATKDLRLDVEDTISTENLHESFDLVVLATGVVPNTADAKIPFELNYDAYGFVDGSTDVDGVYAAGCAHRPCDVSRTTKEATAAVLKAVQCLSRGARSLTTRLASSSVRGTESPKRSTSTPCARSSRTSAACPSVRP